MSRTALAMAALMCSSCAVPAVYMVSRTAEFTPCTEDEIEIVSPAPDQDRGTFEWVAQCRGVRVACTHTIRDHEAVIECAGEGGAEIPAAPPSEEAAAAAPAQPEAAPQAAPAPVESASSAPAEPPPPPPAPAEPEAPLVDDSPPPDGAVTRTEIMNALATVHDQLRACVPASAPGPATVTISMVVGSDGSLTFLGTEPAAPPEIADCLARALENATVRATTAEPFNFTSNPIDIQAGR